MRMGMQHVSNALQVLTKAHRLLPDKWHGLQDVEKRYRQRYVDCISNPEVKDVFKARSLVVSTLRRTLEDSQFLEVETPVRSPISSVPYIDHLHACGLWLVC